MPFPNVTATNITFQSVTPTIVLRAINGREQRTQTGSQYFTFTATFSNLSEADGKTLLGFIGEVRGNLTSFTLTFPDYSNIGDSSGAYSGTINCTATAGATTVSATSSATSGTNVFKPGDLIKFSSHDKVYLVTNTVNATTGGALSINISPPLRANASGTVTHKSVPVTVRLAEDINGFNMDPTFFSSYDLKFIEVL